jgi:hypothetical protein
VITYHASEHIKKNIRERNRFEMNVFFVSQQPGLKNHYLHSSMNFLLTGRACLAVAEEYFGRGGKIADEAAPDYPDGWGLKVDPPSSVRLRFRPK